MIDLMVSGVCVCVCVRVSLLADWRYCGNMKVEEHPKQDGHRDASASLCEYRSHTPTSLSSDHELHFVCVCVCVD